MNEPSTTPPLTPEQEHALDASAGVLQGDTYVLLRKDAVFRWFGFDSAEDLREELRPAFEAADRGDLEEWDVDAFLARMHEERDPGAN
jgi:hypothetical protein